MATWQPQSFLPQDKVTPAIQQLGQTLGAIKQNQIQEQTNLIQGFNNLVDVSLDGVLMKHQEEILGDVDTFKNEAAKIYSQAAETGGKPNYKQFTELNSKKKNLLYKVNQSSFLKEQYKKAMEEAVKLDKAGKLDPKTKEELNKWRSTVGNIEDTVDPMSLVWVKPVEVDWIKKAKAYEANIFNVETFKNRAKPVSPKEAADVIQNEYPIGSQGWMQYREIKENLGIVSPKDDDQTALMKIAQNVSPKIDYTLPAPPTTVTINQPTPRQAGLKYQPLTNYQKVMAWPINGKEVRGQVGEYDQATGMVKFIPVKPIYKEKAANAIATRERALQMATTEEERARHTKELEKLKSNSSNIQREVLDTENAVQYPVDAITGARNAYSEITNRGGQKIDYSKSGSNTKSFKVGETVAPVSLSKEYTLSEIQSMFKGISAEQIEALKTNGVKIK